MHRIVSSGAQAHSPTRCGGSVSLTSGPPEVSDLSEEIVGADEADPGTVGREERTASAGVGEGPSVVALQAPDVDLPVGDEGDLCAIG